MGPLLRRNHLPVQLANRRFEIRSKEDAGSEVRLQVKSELRKLGLMTSAKASWCRHPISADYYVPGKTAQHIVGLYQETRTERWIIEGITMSRSQRVRTRERAGYLNYVLGDIRSSDFEGKTNTVAIVSVADEDRESDTVKYAMEAVDRTAEIVDWNVEHSRNDFLKRREAIARMV